MNGCAEQDAVGFNDVLRAGLIDRAQQNLDSCDGRGAFAYGGRQLRGVARLGVVGDQDTHRRRSGTGSGNQQRHQRKSLSEFQHNPRVESAPEFHKPDASMFWSASGRIQAFLFAST